MTDECIHGFEPGLCAICFPKVVEEAPKPVRERTPRSTGTRATAPRVRVEGGSGRGATVERVAPRVDASAQRLYRLVHVRDLPAIVEAGALEPGTALQVPLWSADAAAERSDATVLPTDEPLDDFVDLALSPDWTPWRSIRDGAPHPRVEPELRGSDPADFVLMVVAIGHLRQAGIPVTLTDGPVVGSLTRFASTEDEQQRMLGRLLDDELAFDGAEALAHGAIPLSAVSVVGVANDRARARVRELLAGIRPPLRVAVYPPWFAGER